MPYRKLGRTSSHRWAMLRNMVTSLVEHERIRTTTAKAKELRRVADRMVTWAKDGTLHARRQAAMVIRTREHLKKLFDVLGPRYLTRAGGYTRILKLQRWRPGDAADMSLIEFVARPGELRPARPPQPPAAAGTRVASSLQAIAANSSKVKVSPPSSSSSNRYYRHYHCNRCTFSTTGPLRSKKQHQGAPAGLAGRGGAGGAVTDQSMPREAKMTVTKKSLSVLVLCTFCTLLAALEYHRGGTTTQSVLQWGSDRLILLGIGGEEKAADGAAGRLLTIGGGEGGEGGGGGSDTAVQEGFPGDRALISTRDPPKRLKRIFFLDAGKAAMQVIQLPIKTVLLGIQKLLSLGRRGGKKQQHLQQSSSATKRGVLDMSSLTEEELLWVEEVYQPLIAMPGVADRGLAVKMPIDRECVARYFIAAQWKPVLRGQPTVDAVLRTLKWREDERVAVLGPEDVLAQAWDGYLYVNGTDMIGRPMIYFRPAFQANQRPEKAIQYLVYTLERALDLSRDENGGVEAYSFVIDCSGFSLSNMPPVNIIKQTFTLLHHHYPTRVGFIIFLYTGSAFQLLWKVLTPLVSPMTRNKILFVPAGEEKKELLKRVKEGQLDEKYGGQREFSFVPHEYFGVSEEEAKRVYEKGREKGGK